MENQLSLWLLSPLQVKELEEGAVCFEELKAEELRSCLVYPGVGYGDQGTEQMNNFPGKTVAKLKHNSPEALNYCFL